MSFKKVTELYRTGLIEYSHILTHSQPPIQQHPGDDCTINPVYWDQGMTNELVLSGLSQPYKIYLHYFMLHSPHLPPWLFFAVEGSPAHAGP